MAANYWVSTQRRHWQFTREGLADIRRDLEKTDDSLVQQYGLPDRRLLSIFFNQRRSARTPILPPGRRMLTESNSRTCKAGKTYERPATGTCYCPGLHSTILHQGRDPQDKSVSRHGYSSLPCLQNGRMSSTHSRRC